MLRHFHNEAVAVSAHFRARIPMKLNAPDELLLVLIMQSPIFFAIYIYIYIYIYMCVCVCVCVCV